MIKKTTILTLFLLLLSVIFGACSSGNNEVKITTPTSEVGIPITGMESPPGAFATDTVAESTPGEVMPGMAYPAPGDVITNTTGESGPNVPLPTDLAQPGLPQTLGGLVQAVDWTGPWTNFLKNAPDDFYIIKNDVLVNELASGTPPFLLDVRDASEIAKDGYIKGAVALPFNSILSNLDKLPAMDQPIIIYSSLGHRGAMTLASLKLLGYSNVRLLEGGISSWLQAGLPVETGTPAEPVAGAAPNIDQNLLTSLDSFMLGTAPTAFYGIEASKLQNQLGADPKPFLLDVRTPEEAASTGSIDGSVFISLKTLLDNLGQLPADKNAPIVIVSTNGHRATIAMMALRMLGYTDVSSLFGGINAWTAAGLPVTK